ncbi:hypothetical protein E2542_SST05515 [Spatholobus suberectus]|nr:hypothetical protein E2542_SST05515 [Spatholobus suberectus]
MLLIELTHSFVLFLLMSRGGKRIGLNFERVEYWLSVGAQHLKLVERVLFQVGLLPPQATVAMGLKGGPFYWMHAKSRGAS